MKIKWIKDPDSAEMARIRRAADISEPRQGEPGAVGRSREPKHGPITRPIVSQEREQEISQALAALTDAENRYIEARAKFRELSGPLGDPSLDAAQIRFAFADQYVTERLDIVPAIPGRIGVNSDRLAAKVKDNWTAVKRGRKTG